MSEIEQLRAERDEWKNRHTLCAVGFGQQAEEKAKLGDEIERLKARIHELEFAYSESELADKIERLENERADMALQIERLTRQEMSEVCERCGGLGYLVGDVEWEPYAVECPVCKDVKHRFKHHQQRIDKALGSVGRWKDPK